MARFKLRSEINNPQSAIVNPMASFALFAGMFSGGDSQAAALGRFRSDGRKTIGGLLMDEDFLAIPGAGVKGELGYWLFVIGYFGGGALFHARFTGFSWDWRLDGGGRI